MISDINPNVRAYYAYKAISCLNGSDQEDFSLVGSAKGALSAAPLVAAIEVGPKIFGLAGGTGVFKGFEQMGAKITAAKATGEIAKVGNIFSKGGMSRALSNYDKITGIEKDVLKASKTAKLAKRGVQVAEKAVETVAKEPGFFGKIFGGIAKPFKAGTKALGKIPVWSGKTLGDTALGKVCKKGGAGTMAAITGVMEAFTQVIPAFTQGGFGEGVKQLGKSAVKVAASSVGFVGGQAIGAAIGTAICPIPIVGTLVGFLAGSFVSSIAEGISKKIVGKSYSEKAADEQKQAMAQEIAKDPNSMQQLKSEAIQILSAKQQSGAALNKDEKELLQYFGTSNNYAPAFTAVA